MIVEQRFVETLHATPLRLFCLFRQPIDVILCWGFVVEHQIEDADHQRGERTTDDVDDLKDSDGLHVEPAGRGAHQLCPADDLEDAQCDRQ